MEKSIFRYILRFSKREQVFLILMTALSLPFLYASLEVPKTIINQAIGGQSFPVNIFGFDFDQTPYLFALCFLFLVLVLINGGFKYYVNVFRGTVGERMLRRLRYQLIERTMRFPPHHFRSVSQGEIVSMVTLETEPLGGYIGDSLSLPAHQGGTLLTLLFFMFVQDPVLGLAAIALYPVQMVVIPKLQRRVNQLGKERVRNVRKLSERLGEMTLGVQDIHAHDTGQYELADFGRRLGTIFNIRVEIYRRKFFIKFLNNFLAQLTPFFFYAIGGYLVIVGDLTLGALVAILAAYKDLSAPWKELLTYYQRMEDARIKYDQLREQFDVPGMLDEVLMRPLDGPVPSIAGPVQAANLALEVEDGSRIVDGATFSFDSRSHIALVGSGGSGKSEIAHLLARQLTPTGGQIRIGGHDLSRLPDAVIGRELSYVDQEGYIRAGTIADNVLYGLRHVPVGNGVGKGDGNGGSRQPSEELRESLRSGNSPYDIDDEWIDVAAAGIGDASDLPARITASLRRVGLEDDVFQIGLRQTVDPDVYPGLAERVLAARQLARGWLQRPEFANLVEAFDADTFIEYGSLAENILFGTPKSVELDVDHLADHPYVIQVLRDVGLADDFPRMGRVIAGLMVELFRDLPPGHEFFDRFSFVSADDLPEFQRILNASAARGIEGLSEADLGRLRALPFRVVPGRHHLGVIDGSLRQRVLAARHAFASNLPPELRGAVEFLDADRYNRAGSVQDNILFGKVAGHRADSASRVGDLILEAVEATDLRDSVIEIGLDFDVGVGGKRLMPGQRQQLAIARCLIKQPKLLVFNEAAGPMDAAGRASMYVNMREAMKDRGLIWVDRDLRGATDFDQVFMVEHGRVAPMQRMDAVSPPVADAGTEPAADVGASAEETSAGGLAFEAELLSAIPFFAGMDRSRLKLIAFTGQRLHVLQDEVLIHQGALGDNAYVILEGSVDIIVNLPQGPTPVATLGKGELVGELALLCDAPRTATIRAREPLTVLSISKDVFVKLVAENSGIGANLSQILANRLVTTMRLYQGGLALYDDVTGLPNARLFADRLRLEVARGRRSGRNPAVLYIVAHDPAQPLIADGDRATAEGLAARLKQAVRASDTVGVLDPLRFAVLIPDVGEETNLERVKARVSAAAGGLAAQTPLTESDVTVTVQHVSENDLDGVLRALDGR